MFITSDGQYDYKAIRNEFYRSDRKIIKNQIRSELHQWIHSRVKIMYTFEELHQLEIIRDQLKACKISFAGNAHFSKLSLQEKSIMNCAYRREFERINDQRKNQKTICLGKRQRGK